MADYITKIRTIDGDKQIDYNALANLPDLSLVGEVKILDSSDNVEARIVTLTDNEDQPIAPRTDADAVAYDENSTVKVILDRFANGIILIEGIDYGSGDPGYGVVGQLYFKKVTPDSGGSSESGDGNVPEQEIDVNAIIKKAEISNTTHIGFLVECQVNTAATIRLECDVNDISKITGSLNCPFEYSSVDDFNNGKYAKFGGTTTVTKDGNHVSIQNTYTSASQYLAVFVPFNASNLPLSVQISNAVVYIDNVAKPILAIGTFKDNSTGTYVEFGGDTHTHSYTESVTTAATCTTAGIKTFTCECGDKYTQSIPATGHSWNDGVVTVEPTKEKEGVKTYTCTVCGETRTETIPALDHEHSYVSTVIDPTCTERGYTEHVCACGDRYRDAYVAATGHNYVDGVCSVCGAETLQVVNVNATIKQAETSDHTHIGVMVEGPVGTSATIRIECDIDDVSKLGTLINNPFVFEYVTDFNTGAYKNFGTNVEQNADGNHVTISSTYTSEYPYWVIFVPIIATSLPMDVALSNIVVYIDDVPKDILAIGTFKDNSTEAYVEFGGDGHTHDYTEIVVTAATCTAAGATTFICGCGDSYAEVTMPTGHNYVDGVCSVCGKNEGGIISPAIINNSVESAVYENNTLTMFNPKQTFYGVTFPDAQRMEFTNISDKDTFGWILVDVGTGYKAVSTGEIWDADYTLVSFTNRVTDIFDVVYIGSTLVVEVIDNVAHFYSDGREFYSVAGKNLGYIMSNGKKATFSLDVS